MDTPTDNRIIRVKPWLDHYEEINKQEFIDRWVNRAKEFHKLALTGDTHDKEEFDRFQNWVKKRASQIFEEVFERQQSQTS